MDASERGGRISQQSFKISTTVLFGLCLVCVSARYYIRIGVQRELSLDDAFLLLGTTCTIAAMVIQYVNMDNMFLVESLTYSPSMRSAMLVTNFDSLFHRVFEFRVLINVTLVLTWVALLSVKASFLALFKRLIDRIPRLTRFWWFTVIFNVLVSAYGTAVYFIACPYFSGPGMMKCLGGIAEKRAVQLAVSQMVLDLCGDILILYIPCHLIYQVRVEPRQKLALAFSLCLTAVVIVFTITRACGLKWQGQLDAVWEIYFQLVSAEVGLVLVSSTAFRTLFVSRSAVTRMRSSRSSSTRVKRSWSSGKISWWSSTRGSGSVVAENLPERLVTWTENSKITTTATATATTSTFASESQSGVTAFISSPKREKGCSVGESNQRGIMQLTEVAVTSSHEIERQAERGSHGLRTFMDDPSEEQLATTVGETKGSSGEQRRDVQHTHTHTHAHTHTPDHTPAQAQAHTHSHAHGCGTSVRHGFERRSCDGSRERQQQKQRGAEMPLPYSIPANPPKPPKRVASLNKVGEKERGGEQVNR